jgi:oligopeptide/dipeptide ABC transporter ATP-binding protein
MDAYPHQLSGGMCQRVMIACAIACKPKLLIADEPTTALDVTIQAQILELLKNIQKNSGMALVLITHNLGIVTDIATRVAVMYAGQIVEIGDTRTVIDRPRHPYTAGLLRCLPDSAESVGVKSMLPSIGGMVPDLARRPTGCQFHPRCPEVQPDCRELEPPMVAKDKVYAKCLHPLTDEDRKGGPK